MLPIFISAFICLEMVIISCYILIFFCLYIASVSSELVYYYYYKFVVISLLPMCEAFSEVWCPWLLIDMSLSVCG